MELGQIVTLVHEHASTHACMHIFTRTSRTFIHAQRTYVYITMLMRTHIGMHVYKQTVGCRDERMYQSIGGFVGTSIPS